VLFVVEVELFRRSRHRFFVGEDLCVNYFVIKLYRHYGLLLLLLRLLLFLQFADKAGQTLFMYRREVILPAKV
jgi:hypothetical protein